MPAHSPLVGPFARAFRTLATVALGAALGCTALAQSPKIQADPVDNSSLDAPLFYQLLIGEMELRQGEPAGAYEVMLDAAKRTRDPQLFRRATDMALEARAGEQALAAARAWRAALPQSIEAHRYLVQILIALKRSNEAVEPLQSFVSVTPAEDRVALITSLPRFFGRSEESKQAGSVLEEALKPAVGDPSTNVAALVAQGRGWLIAGDSQKALERAQRAHAANPADDGPALLALELMQTAPSAETIIVEQLVAKPSNAGLRILYARLLAGLQRYPDAVAQLQTVTVEQPTLAPPWLSLGALHLELKQPREAETALLKYVDVVQAAPDATTATGDDDATPKDEALTQAWLMLSQAAEQRGDFDAANGYLNKIDNTQRALDVQLRRASLLAHQGKMDEARALVRSTPERNAGDGRAKLLAEAQLLRDAKDWAGAEGVLAKANQQFPDDPDLLYEQSMMAEKLNRLEQMERLLRKVIAIKPDYHHAYNALGYSLAERNMRLPEAKALIERALQLQPGEPFITDSVGWVEYRMGRKEEALKLLRQAYSARPDTEIGAHLGEVLWVTGAKDEARKVWNEASQRDKGNDVLRETLSRLRVNQ